MSRSLVQAVAILAFLGALLFLPAWRWDWVQGWLFLAAYALFLLFYIALAHWGDPELAKERRRKPPDVRVWDRAILRAYGAMLVATLVVAGVDAGRFRWSSVPLPIQAAAWLGLVSAGGLIAWSLGTNTYLSRVARIQADRGQVVVSTGPYRHVRHPMYLGIAVLFLCTPPALGSWWALIPGSVIAILFVLRTALEDRMLRAGLEGYEAYTRSVRYRLFPGVW